jgi:DUF4097 and DUF4098 domain-containing protein YvlB
LQIRLPKHWTRYTPFGGGESVSLTIEVPTGSRIEATTGLGDLRCEGELGEVRCRSGMGDIRLDHTGPLQATSGYGDVVVDRVDGDARLKTGSGELRVGAVHGAATIKNGNGETSVGVAAGELQIRSANGSITVGTARDSVTARTANGDIRIGDVRHGRVVMETAAGELEVGIHQGTAAWLDLNTRYGSVRNGLEDTSGPEGAEDTVEIRARTAAGDITVRRADRALAPTS